MVVFGKRSTTAEEPRAPAASARSPVAAPAPPAAPQSNDAGRVPFPSSGLAAPMVAAPSIQPGRGNAEAKAAVPQAIDIRRSETYYETKSTVFGALIEAIDLAQLARLDADSAREEIRDIVNEIVAIKNIVL